ncbi:MAG TPA: hypothetical protein VFW80_06205 [Gaiellaceae bacterium]|nr:hypothetical protein [Gaiellaceae bacterium]
MRYELPVRAACLVVVLVVLLAGCGGSVPSASPLAGIVEHLREHGFEARELTPAPTGDPRPEAAALVRLDGGTATILAFGSEDAARAAATRFAAEEQAAPERVRVQREGLRLYVGHAERLPFAAVAFEDVVFTAEAEHD